jgi:hypothetical protein
MKVPARPKPGIGRKTNCWWSWDVPTVNRPSVQVCVMLFELWWRKDVTPPDG